MPTELRYPHDQDHSSKELQDALQLEQALIIQEIERRKATGQEVVLSPRQAELITKFTEELRGKVGAGVLVSGSPGTGKSVFLEMFAQALESESNGAVRVTAQPMVTSLDLIGTARQSERELLATTFIKGIDQVRSMAENEQPYYVNQLMVNVLKAEVFNVSLSQNQAGKLIGQLCRELGISFGSDDEQAASDFFIKKPRQEWPNEIVNLLGGVSESLRKLHQYFAHREQHEILSGLKNIDPGPLYYAATKGLTFVINEVDKMAMNDLSRFGWGLEDLLQSKPGDIGKTAQGLTVEVDSGFLVLASANDLSKVPDNIRRRFINVDFSANLEDLIFQARVLLSDDEGKIIINSEDEAKLARFLLWWEGLGRHRNVAFNSNILASLCSILKQGQDFEQALDGIIEGLPPEFVPIYAVFLQRGNKADYQQEEFENADLNLARLNSIANRKYIGSEQKPEQFKNGKLVEHEATEKAVSVYVDHMTNTVRLATNVERNQFTHAIEGTPVAEYQFKQLDGLSSANPQSVEVVGHTPLGQMALIKTEASMAFFDLLTGHAVPLLLADVDKHGVEKTSEFSWGNKKVLAIHWSDEHNAVAVIENQNKELQLLSLHREMISKPGSTLSTPQLLVRNILNVSLPDGQANAEVEVNISDTHLDITAGSAHTSYEVNTTSTTKPFKKVRR